MTDVSCVYCIKHKLDTEWENVYIGIATTLSLRIKNHKRYCYDETHKNYNSKLYKYIRDNGGFDNFEFVVIEESNEINELRIVEYCFRRLLKPSLDPNLDCPLRDHSSLIKQTKWFKEQQYNIKYCECGGQYTNNNYQKQRHFKTKKHQDYLLNKK